MKKASKTGLSSKNNFHLLVLLLPFVLLIFSSNYLIADENYNPLSFLEEPIYLIFRPFTLNENPYFQAFQGSYSYGYCLDPVDYDCDLDHDGTSDACCWVTGLVCGNGICCSPTETACDSNWDGFNDDCCTPAETCMQGVGCILSCAECCARDFGPGTPSSCGPVGSCWTYTGASAVWTSTGCLGCDECCCMSACII